MQVVNGIEALTIIDHMSQNQNTKVIVTGASGYIGGAICIELKTRGYTVIGVDRRPLPEHLNLYVDQFVNECFTHPWCLEPAETADAIIHCAGTSLVGPSMIDPAEYYNNNAVKTAKFLDYIRRWNPTTKFIFSSSASVYGSPDSPVLFEGSKTEPISPYGESKLMTESMLHWYEKCYGLQYVSFRYFNACGAVEGGAHGQEPGATHIFAKLFEAALTNKEFTLYGASYPTLDGTCIRDYVHVTDIAKAHVIAIDENLKGIYNIGSIKGYSNLQIFNKVDDFLVMEQRLNKGMVMHVESAREGDPAMLIANSDKLQQDSSWRPEKDIDQIIMDLYDWYNSTTYEEVQKRSPAFNPL